MRVAVYADPIVRDALRALFADDGVAVDAHADVRVSFVDEAVHVNAQVLPLPVVYADLLRAVRIAAEDDVFTDKERAVLDALHAAGATGLSVAELATQVWGLHPETDTHTVETHVWRLRQKLAPEALSFCGGRYRLYAADVGEG